MKSVRAWLAPLLLTALLASTPSVAQYVVSIDGFLLAQGDQAVHKVLGEPVRTVQYEGSRIETYSLGAATQLEFRYAADLPHRVYSMQISGEQANVAPVAGVRLGDAAERVRSLLGEPVTADRGLWAEETELRFEHFNGAIRLGPQGHVSAIRIELTREFLAARDPDPTPLKGFLDALEQHDPHAIADWLAPDVEVFWGDTALTIDERFADFRDAPDAELLRLLDGPTDSVLSAARGTGATRSVRHWEQHEPGLAYRFEHNLVLDEVVFTTYGGRWRVWEVAFREGP